VSEEFQPKLGQTPPAKTPGALSVTWNNANASATVRAAVMEKRKNFFMSTSGHEVMKELILGYIMLHGFPLYNI
jgi:hypothetical protein